MTQLEEKEAKVKLFRDKTRNCDGWEKLAD